MTISCYEAAFLRLAALQTQHYSCGIFNIASPHVCLALCRSKKQLFADAVLMMPDSGKIQNPLAHYPGVVCDCNREWEEVLSLGYPHSYKKGEVITFSGASGRNFTYMQQGFIHSINQIPNGLSRISLFLFGGTLFHEAMTTQPDAIDNNYFLCKTDCQCYEFDGKILYEKKFVMQYPHLMTNLASSLAYKLIKHSSIGNAVCLMDKFTLVCWYLWTMSNAHGKQAFTPRLSQLDIMNLLGISKSSMTRIINTLKEKNILVHFTKNTIEIKDPERLQSIIQKEK